MKETNTKRAPNRSGWVMLAVVILLYAAAAFFNNSNAYNALKNSLNVLQLILPVLLIVVLLMALINSFIAPKKIAKHLGKESGIKGWSIALLGGLLSHGSGYVWYPVLSDLRRHGVRDGLIIAFFYARAIKLPWLPMMVAYFGTGFTIALTFYILLGALVQGILADLLLTPHDQPPLDKD